MANIKSNWYMITTSIGKENGVLESLKNVAKNEKSKELIDFFVATVPALTPKGKEKTKNLYPGYIFVNMIMTDDAWFKVRNTQYVTGLVGSSGERTKPTPVSPTRMEKIRDQVKMITRKFNDVQENGVRYNISDYIEVISGPMTGTKGEIKNIDYSKRIIVLDVEIFGRNTPTEFSFDDIQLIK